MQNPADILVVEDDRSACLSLITVLAENGYRAVPAFDGASALALLSTSSFDVVVSDLQLGDINGVEVMHAARRRPEPPEVIILTGYATVESAIDAVRSGARDYLIKPCPPERMLNVITEAVNYRREQMQMPSPAELRHVGDLIIDTRRQLVVVGKRPVHLTPIEYRLLVLLAGPPLRVHSYSSMVNAVYGYDADVTEARRLLKDHLSHLRRKLPDGVLRTQRGEGCYLDPEGHLEDASSNGTGPVPAARR